MSTLAPPPGTSSDYIFIPEQIRSEPVAGSRIPARLRHLLHYAGIQSLGDLHGKRLSEFREFRGCGTKTLSSLKSMILLALHPGANPDPRAWPFPLRRYTPSLTLAIPVTCANLRVRDLPVSTRLAAALKIMGIGTLGQLDGLSIRELVRTRNLGPVTIAELGDLLRRAEAGEFTFSKRELASKTPADLLRLIDTLVSQLPERRRTVLTLYFGATAQGPQTLRQIGLRNGITGGRVGQQLTRAIRSMLRQGNPRLLALIGLVDRAWARSPAPQRPELVSTWQDPASPFQYCPDFYVWLIPRLRLEAELPCGEPSAMDRASANHA